MWTHCLRKMKCQNNVSITGGLHKCLPRTQQRAAVLRKARGIVLILGSFFFLISPTFTADIRKKVLFLVKWNILSNLKRCVSLWFGCSYLLTHFTLLFLIKFYIEIFQAKLNKRIYQTLKYCNLYQLNLYIKFSKTSCKGLAVFKNAFFSKYHLTTNILNSTYLHCCFPSYHHWEHQFTHYQILWNQRCPKYQEIQLVSLALQLAIEGIQT